MTPRSIISGKKLLKAGFLRATFKMIQVFCDATQCRSPAEKPDDF
jgi:hypothetical protein